MGEVVAVIGHPLDEMEGESLARAMLRFNTSIVALFDAMILNPGAYLGPGEEFRVTGTRGEVVVERGMEGRVNHSKKVASHLSSESPSL